MRLQFALENERDYFAAEALAAVLHGNGSLFDLLSEGLGPAENALLLAAGLLPYIDGLVAELTQVPPSQPGGPYRWLLAAHCIAHGRCHDAALATRLGERLIEFLMNEWAREALVTLGEVAPFLSALRHADLAIRRAAADTLATLAQDADAAVREGAVAAVLAALHDEDDNVRSAAVRALAKLDWRAARPDQCEQVIAALEAVLANPESDDRIWRVLTLTACLPQMDLSGVSRATIDHLVALLRGSLNDPSIDVRAAAIEALGMLAPGDPEAIRWLWGQVSQAADGAMLDRLRRALDVARRRDARQE